jgi:hypothetical protein
MLDSFFSGSEYKISFIKCDVEGHELSCIKSSLETIEQSNPPMLIEISTDPDCPDSEAFQIFDMLRALGYHT